MKHKAKVEDYYQYSTWLYKFFYFNNESMGMHHGFWDKNTKNRHQAMINENQEVVNLGKIKRGQKVLDAGCGVGGTAIYIAKTTGAKVTGTTLTENQVKIARKLAKRHKVNHLVNFEIQDFNYTNFKDKTFDAVFGIESISHAEDKLTFLKEAYRVLKPGGKLIIIDGYAARVPRTRKEKNIIELFSKSFVFSEFKTADKMTKDIEKAGFINTTVHDKTDDVKKSVDWLYNRAKVILPIVRRFKFLPIPYIQFAIDNGNAIYCERKGIDIGLAKYAIHYAEKPRK